MTKLEKKFKKKLPKSLKKYIRFIKFSMRRELINEDKINDKIRELLKKYNFIEEDVKPKK